LDADYLVQVGSRPLALRVMTRTLLGAANGLDQTRVGVAASLSKKGGDILRDHLLSVVLELTDLFTDPGSTKDRLRLSLTVGLPFKQ
jgi:hypothetical protein